MTDKELQREEWDSFQAVFPDFISSPLHASHWEPESATSSGELKLEIPVSLEYPHEILISQHQTSHSSHTVSVSALPPLLLHVTLPPCYPSSRPPEIDLLRATGLWLVNISQLRELLLNLWQPGVLVLDLWATTILSGDFLQTLGLSDVVDKCIRLCHPSPKSLASILQDYEQSQKTSSFKAASHFCALCLNHLRGSLCIELSCTHIFCRSCLQDYWGMCISEGDIDHVCCPNQDCVKQQVPAKEEDVARVVNPDQLKRLKWLRDKTIFDKDPSVIPCPMPFCQTPVTKPATSGESAGWERFRSCDSCGFSFCAYCRRTWHGPITDCPISASESLVLEYLECESDSPARKKLEMRYGLSNIKRLVANYLEERANTELISNTTTKCPQCQTAIEKSLGCNHMTCSRCKSHFCFRCGDRVSPANPYTHFNEPRNACYGKLFDEIPASDAEWQPIAGFDVL